LVEYFFDWVDRELARQGFTPSNPYIQALNYVRERRAGFEVFLTDPDVPIDTNHIERAENPGYSVGPSSAPNTSASSNH
jgi:transposase